MFPDITDQQRGHAVSQGRIRVGGLDDFQLAGISHQPDPATAELTHTAGHEFFFEVVIAAEVGVDFFCNGAGRGTTTIGAKAVPEEAVVVVLANIVEQGATGFTGFQYQCFQGIGTQLGLLYISETAGAELPVKVI